MWIVTVNRMETSLKLELSRTHIPRAASASELHVFVGDLYLPILGQLCA